MYMSPVLDTRKMATEEERRKREKVKKEEDVVLEL